MVTGGRIQHHLAQRLPDPKNTVIFIGFQAPGTRGQPSRVVRQKSKSMVDGSHPSANSGLGAVQRPRRYARTVAVAADFYGQACHNLPCPWRTGGFIAIARDYDERLGWNVQVAQWMQQVEV